MSRSFRRIMIITMAHDHTSILCVYSRPKNISIARKYCEQIVLVIFDLVICSLNFLAEPKSDIFKHRLILICYFALISRCIILLSCRYITPSSNCLMYIFFLSMKITSFIILSVNVDSISSVEIANIFF